MRYLTVLMLLAAANAAAYYPDYFPLTPGNQWIYQQSGAGAGEPVLIEVKRVEVIDDTAARNVKDQDYCLMGSSGRTPNMLCPISYGTYFSTQFRCRCMMSSWNFGSRGPCGVRGYATIFVVTPFLFNAL